MSSGSTAAASPASSAPTREAMELVCETQGRLASFVAARVRSRRLIDEPCDVVQDVAARMLARRGGSLPTTDAARWAYVRRAAWNAIVDAGRRAARRPFIDALDAFSVPSARVEPLELIVHEEQIAAVTAAIDRLDSRSARALRMRLVDGATYRLIVDHCGFPSASAARQAVRRAHLRVVRELGGDRSTPSPRRRSA